MTDPRTDILPFLCRASLGEELPPVEAASRVRDRFFAELSRYQRMTARHGKGIVSRTAIALWKSGAMPQREQAWDFLRQYLRWVKATKGEAAPGWSKEREVAFSEALHLLDSLQPGASHVLSMEEIGNSQVLPSVDPVFEMALRALLAISRSSSRSETEAFYRGARGNDAREASYYLVYRYSTNNGAILKSFLVIRKPAPGARSLHVFNHFLWGGQYNADLSHVYRECEGAIVKMEKSFYFLGYNYTVPADKLRDPDVYKRQRARSKWKPNGIGMIAVEYDDVRPGLCPGVTMTVAAVAQPVVARIAMLHVGTRSSLGIEVSDTLVEPGELPPEAVARDLARTIERLREAGANRFGDALEGAQKDDDIAGGCEKLAKTILQLVDNTPGWGPPPGGKVSRGQAFARGAIESAGPGRPRN